MFNIPSDFIGFDISQIIQTFKYLVFSMICFFLQFRLLLMSFISKKTPRLVIIRYVLISIELSFFITLMVLYKFNNWSEYLEYLFIALVLMIIYFVPPLFVKDKKSSYFEKIIALKEKNRNLQNKTTTQFETFMKRISLTKLMLFSFALFRILSFSYDLGIYNALTKDEFYVITSEPRQVVLYTRSNLFISTEVSEDNKVIEGFYIHEFSGNEFIQYNYQEIGILDIDRPDFGKTWRRALDKIKTSFNNIKLK